MPKERDLWDAAKALLMFFGCSGILCWGLSSGQVLCPVVGE